MEQLWRKSVRECGKCVCLIPLHGKVEVRGLHGELTFHYVILVSAEVNVNGTMQ
jgi:hypothetical protein